MTIFDNTIKSALKEAVFNTINLMHFIIFFLLFVYLISGIYSISSNEIAIVQRFGKIINDKVQPGIYFAFPWPFEKLTKVPVKSVKRLVIDNFFENNGYCITGDNNLVNIQCVIQFNITNPSDYLFQIKEPIKLLQSLACNSILSCISQMPVDEILTKGKIYIASNVKNILQKKLNEIKCGLSVSFIELKDIKPPSIVEKDFSSVVNARIDHEKLINEAQAYRNQKIHQARSYQFKTIQEAKGYQKEVVLKASGDVERFNKLLEEKKQNSCSINILYSEAIKEIMQKAGHKHIIFGDKKNMPAKLKLFNSNN